MRNPFLPALLAAVLVVHTLSAQQGPPPGGPPPMAERLKRVNTKLTTELALNAKQQSSVEQAYKAFFTDVDKLMGPPPARPDRTKLDALAQTRDSKIQKALSKEQFATFQEIEKTLRPPRPGGDGPGGPPPPRQ